MKNSSFINENSTIADIQYRRLFETAQDGILILDGHTGSIVDVNPFLLSLLGFSHEEFIGKKLWELGAFQDIEANRNRFKTLLENDYIQYSDLPLKTQDGYVIAVEFVSNVYMVGDVKTIQCNIRDITARKNAENKLHEKDMELEDNRRQSQKLESLSTLASGIAHEFNNVLAMILPSAEMIAAISELNSKTAIYADRIIDAAKRAASMVKQISIFAQSEQSVLKPTSLQRIVLDLSSLLSHAISKGIHIKTEITSPESMVMGDNGLLQQALLNVALNGVEAMPHGGTLTISLEDTDEQELARFNEQLGPEALHKKYVNVTIKDTGVGIADTLKDRVFDPFFTTKEPGTGTGLGLSIVHGIVKSHHGVHRLDTTPNGGTSVSLYFPLLAQGEARVVPSPPMPIPITTGRKTVLILDDEEPIRETLVELLSHQGYTVLTACNGIEGMKQLRDHSEFIDLVITDLGMPQMDGEEFFSKAKAIHPALKIIIMTGYVNTKTTSKLLALGVADLILKPFSVDTLLPTVRRALAAA